MVGRLRAIHHVWPVPRAQEPMPSPTIVPDPPRGGVCPACPWWVGTVAAWSVRAVRRRDAKAASPNTPTVMPSHHARLRSGVLRERAAAHNGGSVRHRTPRSAGRGGRPGPADSASSRVAWDPGAPVPRRARSAWRPRRARLRGRRGPGEGRAAPVRTRAAVLGTRLAQRGVDRRLGLGGGGPQRSAAASVVPPRRRSTCPLARERPASQAPGAVAPPAPGCRHPGAPRPPGRGALRPLLGARVGRRGDPLRQAVGGVPRRPGLAHDWTDVAHRPARAAEREPPPRPARLGLHAAVSPHWVPVRPLRAAVTPRAVPDLRVRGRATVIAALTGAARARHGAPVGVRRRRLAAGAARRRSRSVTPWAERVAQARPHASAGRGGASMPDAQSRAGG